MPPNDPNSIDINLSLLPGESRTVINSLMEQLSGIATQLTALKTDIVADRAGIINPATGRVFDRGASPTSSSGAATAAAHAETIRDTQTVQQSRPTQTQPAPASTGEPTQARPKVDPDNVRNKLLNASLIQGGRYTLTGNMKSLSDDEAEVARGLHPEGFGPVRKFFDRAAQVTAPDRTPSRRQRGGGGRDASDGSGDDGGYRSGGRGPTSGDPGGLDGPPGGPGWTDHFTQDQLSSQFSMPRLGKFTPQDSLNMVAKMLGRRAESARQGVLNRGAAGETITQEDIAKAGYAQGTAGAMVGRMANAVPFFANMGNIRPLGSLAAAFHPMNLMEVGQYSRGTDVAPSHMINVPGVGPVEVRSPADLWKTAKAGINIEKDFTLAGARSPYMNADTARSIGGSLMEQGFDEKTASAVISRYIAPARGSTLNLLPPEQMAEMAMKALREGGNNMNEFPVAMSELAAGAKAARMSIQEFAQSADEYAQKIQQSGGTYLQGVQQASLYSAATGLAPQVESTLASNGIVQGAITAQTGILPSLQGSLPVSVRGQVEAQTVARLIKQFSHGLKTRTIHLPGGGVIHQSAGDQVEGMVGQVLGNIDQATIHKMRTQAGFESSGRVVTAGVEGYMNDINKARDRYGNDHTPGSAFMKAVSRINQGQGDSHIGLADMSRRLKDAGIDPTRVLKRGVEGSDAARAVAEALKQREQKVFGDVVGKGSSNDAQTKVTVGFAPGVAQQLLKVTGISPGNDRKHKQRKGQKTDSMGIIQTVNAIAKGIAANEFYHPNRSGG